MKGHWKRFRGLQKQKLQKKHLKIGLFYGKLTYEINKKVKDIIEKTPKGKDFYTKFLGPVEMYMPKDLIIKNLEKIKTMPLIK